MCRWRWTAWTINLRAPKRAPCFLQIARRADDCAVSDDRACRLDAQAGGNASHKYSLTRKVDALEDFVGRRFRSLLDSFGQRNSCASFRLRFVGHAEMNVNRRHVGVSFDSGVVRNGAIQGLIPETDRLLQMLKFSVVGSLARDLSCAAGGRERRNDDWHRSIPGS